MSRCCEMLPLLLLLLLSAATTTTAAASGSTGEEAAPASLPPWAKQPTLRHLLMDGGGGSWPPAADAVVAQGGGGRYITITDALRDAPKGKRRYVIRVKQGVYNESLNITRKNVVLLGDGIGKTIITGEKSNATGTDMYMTATVSKYYYISLSIVLSIQLVVTS